MLSNRRHNDCVLSRTRVVLAAKNLRFHQLFKTFLVFLQCRLNDTTLLFADSGHQDGTYIMERRLPTFCLWRI
ncbi:hypothetical protein HMPREF1991_01212 [Hoylesella loescheii DSM 19665 = JCM 12249 = ATCC 15930]|uniref:Uncharacterized protein n=1 Tax=Hoylesella loescheii DSM 19665 = JCM 12249 = ATCC 15930 TaxID=1122985 RepID=A0A069QL26_HOYLO|nr:hypothetical protein HMPREF1991_01212 [Hoylesella loescheii DSM 19665 = JCM 12249 = ATCC 15930]